MVETDVEKLWQSFFKLKDDDKKAEIRRKLVEHYYPLVKKVAQRMHLKIVSRTVEELTSMGIDGLYDAINKRDPLRTNKFETYAVPRIKGSILDEIRKTDWVPRLVRSRTNEFDMQRRIAESAAGKKLTPFELAQALGKTEEEIDDLIETTTAPVIYSVQDVNNDEENNGMSIEQIEDSNLNQPLNDMIRKEFFNKIFGASFTPQERKIIWLYYFEKKSMKEISKEMNLSESRISQMRSKILTRARQKKERNPDYFADIWKEVTKFRGEQVFRG